MKKLFSLVVFALLAVSSFAQSATDHFFVVPKAGINLGFMTNYDASVRMRSGLVAGIGAGYQFADYFALTADALYSMQGINGDVSDNVYGMKVGDKFTAKIDYLIVPVLANFYVAPGLALKIGLQAGFNLSAKMINDINVLGFNQEVTIDFKDLGVVNPFELALPLGISYEYKNVILDARYNIGLIDVFKTDDVSIPNGYLQDIPSTKNQVIQITLGYKLPLKGK